MELFNLATQFCEKLELSQRQERSALLAKTLDFLAEEINETDAAVRANDRLEIIDGFGDIAFIAINGIYKEFRSNGDAPDVATCKVSEVFKRICTANLAKIHPDGSVKYMNNKVQKPEGWQPPDHSDLL